jgi:hypothetical protein
MKAKPGFVTVTEFARRAGVSDPAVSKAIQNGRLRVYDGRGKPVSPWVAGRKWLKPAEAALDWDDSRLRFDDFALLAAETKTTGLQESLSTALARALRGIVCWTDELVVAGREGGQEAVSVFLMLKSADLGGEIANLLQAAGVDLGDVG